MAITVPMGRTGWRITYVRCFFFFPSILISIAFPIFEIPSWRIQSLFSVCDSNYSDYFSPAVFHTRGIFFLFFFLKRVCFVRQLLPQVNTYNLLLIFRAHIPKSEILTVPFKYRIQHKVLLLKISHHQLGFFKCANMLKN